MKRVFSFSLTLIVTISYIVALAGFGIHECSDSGSSIIVSLYGDVSCEKIHKHYSGHSEDDGNCTCGHCADAAGNHDEGCCSTRVVLLDDQQDVEYKEASLTAPVSLPDLCLYCDAFHFDCRSYQDLFTSVKIEKPPLPGYDIYLSYISQWRL